MVVSNTHYAGDIAFLSKQAATTCLEVFSEQPKTQPASQSTPGKKWKHIRKPALGKVRSKLRKRE
jgi:hypothetical protein